jgi:hypothetical protein
MVHGNQNMHANFQAHGRPWSRKWKRTRVITNIIYLTISHESFLKSSSHTNDQATTECFNYITRPGISSDYVEKRLWDSSCFFETSPVGNMRLHPCVLDRAWNRSGWKISKYPVKTLIGTETAHCDEERHEFRGGESMGARKLTGNVEEMDASSAISLASVSAIAGARRNRRVVLSFSLSRLRPLHLAIP